jgi:uncharacterized membrane protein
MLETLNLAQKKKLTKKAKPNNIVLFIYVNKFEPNLVLVNVNKLKPYTYVNQTLKGIYSSKN